MPPSPPNPRAATDDSGEILITGLSPVTPLLDVPRSGSDHGRIGKAVEMLCAGKLLLLGKHVSIPLEDDGIDLVVDYRVRVQVKSSAQRQKGRLKITICKGTSPDRRRDMAKVDVFVVYARDSERWWVLPMSAFSEAGYAVLPRQFALTEHWQGEKGKLGLLSSHLDAWWVFDALTG